MHFYPHLIRSAPFVSDQAVHRSASQPDVSTSMQRGKCGECWRAAILRSPLPFVALSNQYTYHACQEVGCSGLHALYITYSVGCFINYLKSNIEQMFTSKTCAQVKCEFEFLLASSASDSCNASPIYKPMLFLHSFRYNYCEKASQNK